MKNKFGIFLRFFFFLGGVHKDRYVDLGGLGTKCDWGFIMWNTLIINKNCIGKLESEPGSDLC